MMKLILVVVVVLITAFGYAQSDHDVRLLERYTESELTTLEESEPEAYAVLLNALEKGIFIGEIPTQKGKDVQFDGALDIDPEEEHTFISLGIELKENNYQYFKITGTNKMVGVLPKSLLK